MNQFHHVFSFFFTISLRSAINFSIRHIFPIFKCFTQSVSNLVGTYWGGRLQTIIIVFIINDENPGSSVGKTVTFTVVFFFFSVVDTLLKITELILSKTFWTISQRFIGVWNILGFYVVYVEKTVLARHKCLTTTRGIHLKLAARSGEINGKFARSLVVFFKIVFLLFSIIV